MSPVQVRRSASDNVPPVAHSTLGDSHSSASGQRLRLLVTIASFGDKNLDHLKRIISDYLSMEMQVRVVVVSNAPKDLGSEVEVVVGLPSANPWSLPFAHKPILAKNVDAYDLFIYSEDDMAVTEANIRAFLRVTPCLMPDEIAGFLRYELTPDGGKSLPEAHGVHHWKPESVSRRGEQVVAEFSNEHAAFYLLTQQQLRRAIASGGFARLPYEDRYDMLCTAATDPYTSCGFRKVICISALPDFLIHHLPNRYVGQLGTPLPAIQAQVETLLEIERGHYPACTLCQVDSKLQNGRWSKGYDEAPKDEVLRLVPTGAESVLSVGGGMGASERELQRRGMMVTVLPLDSVTGVAAARLGMEVIFGSLSECREKLQGRRFDCVFLTNLLHLQPDPTSLLELCCEFVGKGGGLVLLGPNFQSVSVWAKRIRARGDYRKLGDFVASGVNPSARRKALNVALRLGFRIDRAEWINESPDGSSVTSILTHLAGRFIAGSWGLQLHRVNARPFD